MNHVILKNRKLIRQGSILDFYEDEMQLPNGEIEHWDFVSHRKGAAAVVPVLEDGRLLLVKQFRPALERYTWELPAGSRDSSTEDTLKCAMRELYEETGYTGKSYTKLLSLKTTVAFCDELVDIYLAKDVSMVDQQHLDPAEEISMRKWTMDELLDKIFRFEIQDAKTVAGIMAYHAYSETMKKNYEE